MIHDGDYYSIVDKDNILSLMDEIEQKIIWMFQRNFIWENIMFSRYLGQDPDTPMYMEALSGREDCPCETSRRSTEEDLFVRGGGSNQDWDYQSDNLALMGTMRPLVKHRTTVLVLIAKKSRYQWTMNVQRVLNTNLLHLQMENF